jgi:Uri superfamily endonuclease
VKEGGGPGRTSTASRKTASPAQRRPASAGGGAYELHLLLSREVTLRLNGRAGDAALPAGRYVYFGSALAGVSGRVSHHLAVDRGERKGRHWHIDRLLASPACRVTKVVARPGRHECELCLRRIGRRAITLPVKGFGSSDCRSGCGAHLLRIGRRKAGRSTGPDAGSRRRRRGGAVG